jgi:hypothetical protein
MKGLPWLLDRQLRNNAKVVHEVRDLAPSIFSSEEVAGQLGDHRRHGKQARGNDHRALTLEEGQPPLAKARVELNTPQSPGEDLPYVAFHRA